MSRPTPVEIAFFYDYGSPFSYLTDTQLGALAVRTGACVVYRPMLLGAVLGETGNSSPMSVPAKARYAAHDLARWAARYGVPIAPNRFFPFSTLALMRGAIAALRAGCFAAYHENVFRGLWVSGLNLADSAVLRETLARGGLDADHLLTLSAMTEVKEALRADTAEAVARGVFGAPTFFVGEQMFWGNDRLAWVEAECMRLGAATGTTP
jgi:2-hydroxychromene-2-carboxylate isomerase